MSPPQPQSTQTLQFLSNVLSQRGPTSLPYSEDVKWLIRQHLLSLSEAFPSLTPKTATFTHNDGRQVNLLQADGTIPMTYQSVTYNIPVVIWLTESYPRHAPMVFVNPTRDMIIKRPHAHVTPSGLVQIPYLQNWIYPSSNLVELGRSLSVLFGRDPPLYSQQQQRRGNVGGSNVSVGHSPSSNVLASNHSQSVNGSMGGGVGGGGLGGRMSFPPSPYRTEDPSEVYKRNAVSKIVEMVHGDMVGLRKAREGEMDGLFNAQGVLRKREEEVNKGLKELLDEKEALEQQLQMVLMNTDVLEGWVKENEEKARKAGGGSVDDVDEAFEIGDVLSKQMLEASAADLALEDVIYGLDKGVQDGVVPFDQYLRNVRLLAREQFFHRAMTAKVRAAQMQARVSNMASRTSQYAL